MSENKSWTDTVRLQKISKAFWESAALMSAVELGVFSAIAKGDNTIEQVAAAVSIEPLNAERLLVVLAAMELLTRTGDEFTNAADVTRFLVEGEPSYAGPWMLFGKEDRTYKLGSGTTSAYGRYVKSVWEVRGGSSPNRAPPSWWASVSWGWRQGGTSRVARPPRALRSGVGGALAQGPGAMAPRWESTCPHSEPR